MSRYISWDDVANRYPVSAKQAGGAEPLKTNYINGAEAEVDARLAVKYSTPFSPVPDLVRDLCIDLAYFKMILGNPKQSKTIKDYLDDRFKAIIEGTMVLTVSGTIIGTSERAWSDTQEFGSAFGVDAPENWQVSSTWMQANEDARF